MDSTADRERRVFLTWLRTGQVPLKTPGTIEYKFNPWHDPHDGRFTFANSGRYFNGWLRGGFSGGSGGRFGGGGATGSWSVFDRRVNPSASGPRSTRTIAQMNISRVTPAPAPNAIETKPAVRPITTTRKWRTVVRNGYEYQIDESQRTRQVVGTLTMTDTPLRSRRAQARAGGVDRRPTDDGGHYIAARFKGPMEAFNHFAQDRNFNRGRYRVLEDEWAKEKRLKRRVSVQIAPRYDGSSMRPSVINVWFTVNGVRKSARFDNEKGR
jgi:hypothetical protein